MYSLKFNETRMESHPNVLHSYFMQERLHSRQYNIIILQYSNLVSAVRFHFIYYNIIGMYVLLMILHCIAVRKEIIIRVYL